MSLHTQLPIYKSAYDLFGQVVESGKDMPRQFRPAIGGRMIDLSLSILMLVLRANCTKDRVPHIDAMLECNEELQLLARLCQDKRFISRKQYAATIALTTSVGKQASGWKKYAASPVT